MAKQKIRKSKYKTSVKKSSAGLGLFAEEAIPKDAFVIEYFGPLLTNDEADERLGKYLFEVNSRWVIDGTSRKNTARYLNHSCKPNCESDTKGKRMFVYTLRKIKPGEELTYDYGKEYFDDIIKPHGCRCDVHRKN